MARPFNCVRLSRLFAYPDAGTSVAVKLKETQSASNEWSGTKQSNVDAV